MEALSLAKGVALSVGAVSLELTHPVDYIELQWEGDVVRVVAGDPASIEGLTVDGAAVVVR